MDVRKLITVANDLNDTMGLKPRIVTKGATEADLLSQIEEASKGITNETKEEDEKDLLAVTVTLLKNLGFWPVETVSDSTGVESPLFDPDLDLQDEVVIEKEAEEDEEEEVVVPKKVEKVAPINKKKADIVVVEEDDDIDVVDDVPPVEDYTAIRREIKLTNKLEENEKLKILKKIVKAYKVFSPIHKSIIGMFNTDEVRDAMTDLLSRAETGDVPEKMEEPVPEPEKQVRKTKKVVEVPDVPQPVVEPEKQQENAPEPVEKVEAVRAIRLKRKYTRIDALCEALKEEPITIDEWIDRSNQLMLQAGRGENSVEARFIIRYILHMEDHFEFPVKMPRV